MKELKVCSYIDHT